MVSTEYINGSVLYPTYNGLQAVIMGIVGVIFFGDKLSSKQKLGMIFGIASIALMNIKLGFSFSF
jgi:multidrug transporter EmrE-like cation transporter